jgi:hypothetical protein
MVCSEQFEEAASSQHHSIVAATASHQPHCRSIVAATSSQLLRSIEDGKEGPHRSTTDMIQPLTQTPIHHSIVAAPSQQQHHSKILGAVKSRKVTAKPQKESKPRDTAIITYTKSGRLVKPSASKF